MKITYINNEQEKKVGTLNDLKNEVATDLASYIAFNQDTSTSENAKSLAVTLITVLESESLEEFEHILHEFGYKILKGENDMENIIKKYEAIGYEVTHAKMNGLKGYFIKPMDEVDTALNWDYVGGSIKALKENYRFTKEFYSRA